MKNLKYGFCMIVLVMLMGCNGANNLKNKAKEGDAQEKVAEWLTIKGNGKMPNVVLVSGDEEYRSEEALTQLARILSQRHGFECTVLFAQDPKQPGIINPNNVNHIPGLEKLQSADLMILFTRFRALPDEQMKFIDDYLKSGKPVIGIRTATHAFYFQKKDSASNYLHYGTSYKGDDAWDGGFGRLVLGEKWIAHHGDHKTQSTTGLVASGAENHPIVNGINDGDIWGPSDVYTVRLPLPEDSKVIVNGQVTEREGPYSEEDALFGMRPTDKVPATTVIRKNREGVQTELKLNDPMMPIAWIKTYQIPGGQKGKAFTSTIGGSTDLLAEGTRRLMVNAVFWSLGLEVPQKGNVDVVGTYQPTQFGFHTDSVWIQRKLKITSLE